MFPDRHLHMLNRTQSGGGTVGEGEIYFPSTNLDRDCRDPAHHAILLQPPSDWVELHGDRIIGRAGGGTLVLCLHLQHRTAESVIVGSGLEWILVFQEVAC